MSHIINSFAITRCHTPLLNTHKLKDIFGGADGYNIPLQDGLLKELETILLPSTIVRIIKQISPFVVEVSTEEYSASTPLWTDNRFLQACDNIPHQKRKKLLSADAIISSMKSCLNMPYLWGGNAKGVPEMMEYYPPKSKDRVLDTKVLQAWSLYGMDCSGLLYFATNGFTPRNTAQLIAYGNEVKIQGKDFSLLNLAPLDLIVWKGHVIIYIGQDMVIESLGGKGVLITPLQNRLNEICFNLKRIPLDGWDQDPSIPECERFVIRRWHQEML
jgi:hypothetical protein